jgi:hypothetical protein
MNLVSRGPSATCRNTQLVELIRSGVQLAPQQPESTPVSGDAFLGPSKQASRFASNHFSGTSRDVEISALRIYTVYSQDNGSTQATYYSNTKLYHLTGLQEDAVRSCRRRVRLEC